MASEERRNKTEVEGLYKTKVVQFLGRSVPIILQNDNGPCPLIAISNVLLLRNNLNLSPDTTEIPLQKLLALVAERLIDSNSNVEDKDPGYVKNQQQNISDAIDLLPRLATGIDVNLHFTKIDDFEFTPERAIFDLLGIELYHGWIVDPQDKDLVAAIGSKSYNALMAELVTIDPRNTREEDKGFPEDDCVDFAAATAATLGVPSPCLSKAKSFGDSPISVNSDQRRRGDLEEEQAVMLALQLSKVEGTPSLQSEAMSDLNASKSSAISPIEQTSLKNSTSADSSEEVGGESHRLQQPDLSISQDCNTSCSDRLLLGTTVQESNDSISEALAHQDRSNSNESGETLKSSDLIQNTRSDIVESQSISFTCPEKDTLHNEKDVSPALSTHSDPMPCSEDHSVQKTLVEDTSMCLRDLKFTDKQTKEVSDASDAGSVLNVSEGVPSSLADSEPIYEGEECILDSGNLTYENREPIYEGEIVLAEQADRRAEGDASGTPSMDNSTPEQFGGSVLVIDAKKGELIRNFLNNNASQLTIYGLFCLQEGLKERELCVFFRNNHFSTMFKFNGELYLLATDQGYINQPDLVWEKLNEVNGDSVFMTGEFKEFKAENHLNGSWDEQNAMTSTADYLASIDNGGQAGSSMNSDLQLAIALQQQEFENQPQRQSPSNSQKPSAASHSRLVTGPQVSRSSTNSSSKQETKAKEKCVVM